MLLILTNSKDATADYLKGVLDRNAVRALRIDSDTICQNASFELRDGRMIFHRGGDSFKPSDFSNVWYRRPEKLRHAEWERTAKGRYILEEWTAALEGFLAFIPANRWMNHPANNARASVKIEQLTTARACGLQTPETLVSQCPEAVRRFAKRFDGIIVKPLGHGYIASDDGRDALVYTNDVEPDALRDLGDLPTCPTLFQERIPKSADIRITVVDRTIHAAALTAKDRAGHQLCDIRRDNMRGVTYRPIVLPAEVESSLRQLVAKYGLRFAAIDMAVDDKGQWYFFEVNPNGQWAWLDLGGEMNIAASFVSAFESRRCESIAI